MKKTAVIIMIITIASKIFGFVREMAISNFYGATNISDAYFIAMSIPATIWGLVGVALATGFIPIYTEIDRDLGKRRGIDFTNNVLNGTVVLSAIIFVIAFIFVKPIVYMFASGFSGEVLEITINFTRITLLGVFALSITPVLGSYLQVNKNFAIPALVAFPMNVVVIISIVMSAQGNEMLLAWGYVFGGIAQIVFLLPFAIKKGYKYELELKVKDEYFVRMIHLMIPLMIGNSVYSLNRVIDQTLATQVTVGGVSILNYASRINYMVLSIFVISLVTVMYPALSTLISQDKITEYKKGLTELVVSVSLVVLPAAAGIIILSYPIVELFFGRGEFGPDDVMRTSYVLKFYAFGLIGFSMREVFNKAFYSFHETKIPMIIGAISVLINIILNFILSQIMGVSGLAFATSISALIGSFLLVIYLKKHIGSFGLRKCMKSMIKIFMATAIMAIVVYFSYQQLLGYGTLMALSLSVAIGVLVYAIVIYFSKIDEVEVLLNEIKSIFNK